MPLLTPLASEQASPEARKLFGAIESAFKMVPNIFRTMGYAPKVLEHTLGLNEAIHAELDPKLRELAYMTASRINHCGYCEHYHSMFAHKAGVTDGQLKQLGFSIEAGSFTEVERLVIRFADEWTRQGKASADVVQALAKHLSPAALIVLAATVGLANWTNRFNETFDVQLP
jgi:AhpD family alkylhydroperoxidase